MADYNVGSVKGSVELNTKQIQDAVKQLNALGKAFSSLNNSSTAANKAASSVSELEKSSNKTSKAVANLEAEMLKLDKKAQSVSKSLASSKADTESVARANNQLSKAYQTAQSAIKSSEGDVKKISAAFLQYERAIVDSKESLMVSERAVKAHNEALKREQELLKQLEAVKSSAVRAQKQATEEKKREEAASRKLAAAKKAEIREQNLLETAKADSERRLKNLIALESKIVDKTGESSSSVKKAKDSILQYQAALDKFGRESLEAGRAERQMKAAIQDASTAATQLEKSSNKTSKAVANLEAEMLRLDKKAQTVTKSLASSKAETSAVTKANNQLAKAYQVAQSAIKSSEGDVNKVKSAFLQYERAVVDTTESLRANERAVKANNATLAQSEAVAKKLNAENKKSIREQNLLETARADAERRLQRLIVLERSVIDVTGQSSTAITKAKSSILQYQEALDKYGRSSLEAGRAQRQMQADIQAANIASTRLSSGLESTRGAFRMIRGAAGQAGHQLQDIAVQAQMGTHWLIILGQQGSQILSLLGGYGALAGAVLAIGAAAFYAMGGMEMFQSESEKALGGVSDYVSELRKQLDELNVEKTGKQFLQDQLNAATELKTLLDGISTADIEQTTRTRVVSNPNSNFGGGTEVVTDFAYQLKNQDEVIERLNKIRGLAKEYFDIELGTINASSDQAEVIKQILTLRGQINDLTKEQQAILDKALETEKQKISDFNDELELQRKINALLKDAQTYDEARQIIEETKLRAKYEADNIAEAEIDKMIAANKLESDRLNLLKEQGKEQAKYEKDLAKIQKKFEDNTSEFEELIKGSKEFSKILEGYDGEFALFEISDKQMNSVIKQFKTLDQAVAKTDMDKAVADQMKMGILEGVKDGAKDTKFKTEAEKMGEIFASSLESAIANGDWSEIGNGIGDIFSSAIGSSLQSTISAAMQNAGYSSLMSGNVALAGATIGAGLISRALSGGGEGKDPTIKLQERFNEQLGDIDQGLSKIADNTTTMVGALNSLVGVNRELLNAQIAQQSSTSGAVSAILGETDRVWGDILNIAGVDPKKLIEDVIVSFSGTLSDIQAGFDFVALSPFVVEENLRANLLEGDISGVVSEQFDELRNSVTVFSKALGKSSDEINDILENTQLTDLDVPLTGLGKAEERADAIGKALNAIIGQVVGATSGDVLEQVRNYYGEDLVDIQQRAVTSIESLNDVFGSFGLSASDLGLGLVEQIKLFDDLSDRMGGSSSVMSGFNSVIKNFASEQEQLDVLTSKLSKAFNDLGVNAIPETAEAYYELVKATIASEDATAESISALVNLSPAMQEFISLTESLNGEIEEVSQSFDYLEQQLRNFQAATDAAYSALVKQVDIQKDLLKDQLDSQLDAIKAETDAKLEANKVQTDAAKALVSQIEKEMGGLESAIATLIPEYAPNQSQRRTDAVQTLIRALQTGDLTGVGDAAELAAQIETDNYKTRSSFEYEQARTLNILDDVDKKAKDQLTEAEQQLEALESLRDTIKAQGEAAEQAAKNAYDKQVDQLNAMLQYELDQINELRGIHNTINSIAEALAALDLAQGNEANRRAEIEAAVRQIYLDELGRAADTEGLNYYVDEIMRGDATLQSIREWLDHVGNIGESNIPQFAKGGLHTGGLAMVGENGPEIINTSGAARIHNNSQTQKMLGNAANDELLKELVSEVTELRYLMATDVKYNRRSSEILDQYRSNGFTADEDVA